TNCKGDDDVDAKRSRPSIGKPVKCHARKERVLLVGTRSADHIRASSHCGCIQRPNTWLHPIASRKRQILLAPRAPSIHGTSPTTSTSAIRAAIGAVTDMRFASLKWRD